MGNPEAARGRRRKLRDEPGHSYHLTMANAFWVGRPCAAAYIPAAVVGRRGNRERALQCSHHLFLHNEPPQNPAVQTTVVYLTPLCRPDGAPVGAAAPDLTEVLCGQGHSLTMAGNPRWLPSRVCHPGQEGGPVLALSLCPRGPSRGSRTTPGGARCPERPGTGRAQPHSHHTLA